MRSASLDSDLVAAILPYQWIFAFFGLTLPPICAPDSNQQQTSNWCLRLAYLLYSLYLLVMSVCMSYQHWGVIEFALAECNLDGATTLLVIFMNMSITPVQVAMQLTALFGQRQLQHILAEVAQLEQQIRWLLPSAKGQHNFSRRLLSRSGLMLFVLVALYPFTLIPIMSFRISKFFWALTIFFLVMLQAKYVEYCIAVQLVHELLLQLQQHLLQIRAEINARHNRLAENALYAALLSNQHLLASIWKLVNAIENYFAVPLLLLAIFDALMITHAMNWLYIRMGDGLDLYRLAIALVMLLSLLVPCWLSQSCIKVYNRFEDLVQDTRPQDPDGALSDRLREYSLQLMHQKLIFTCGGFFDMDLKNFGSMVLTISMYIIILIQFKVQTKSAERGPELCNV